MGGFNAEGNTLLVMQHVRAFTAGPSGSIDNLDEEDLVPRGAREIHHAVRREEAL